MPTAARLSLSAQEEPTTASASVVDPRAQMAMMIAAARVLAQQCEDVGDRFAEEARRIHYSEVPERNIMGRTSRQEAEALQDEGIEVFALPVPARLLGTEH